MRVLGITLMFISSIMLLRADPANSSTNTNAFSVPVHYEKDALVSSADAERVQSAILEMTRSANVIWRELSIVDAEDYRTMGEQYQSVLNTREYVRVAWKNPQKVEGAAYKTFFVVEALVWLRKTGVWMCCIDTEGRYVRLGKYKRDILERILKDLPK